MKLRYVVLVALVIAIGSSLFAYGFCTLLNPPSSLERDYQVLQIEYSSLEEDYRVLQEELSSLNESHQVLREEYRALQRAHEVRKGTEFPGEEEISALADRLKPGVVVVSSGRFERLEDIMHGGGAGFVIHPSGYVLTNAHIVRGEASLKVLTADGEVYEAELIAVSPEYPTIDLALVKAPIENPTVLEFGDTSELKKGETNFGIGHPSPFGNWVVVAGEFLEFEYYYTTTGPLGWFYVDRPVSTGESGSPMFNLEGEVVGILYGGHPGEKRLGPEDRIVVWFGNTGEYWSEYALAHDTDTIRYFVAETLGESIAKQIFG